MKFQVIRNCYVFKANALSDLIERDTQISIIWEKALDALS